MRIAIPPEVSPRDFADRMRADIVTLGGETMGTTWSIRFVPTRDLPAPSVAALIGETLGRLVAELSQWERGSQISRFNRAPPGAWRLLSPALRDVLDAGLHVAKASGGAFDPAIGRLASLWGFGPAGARVAPPDDDAIAAVLAGGWLAIEVDGQFARRTADVALDVSGIGKGYAVDAVAEMLAAHGLRHLLVEIGGELRGAGIRPDGQPWWVDVEQPPGAAVTPIRIALHGLSVATSGDYRRWFRHDGTHYAHSLDPRTGRPVANGVASVTVLHPRCMMADAWATALTVLGPVDGMALAGDAGIAAQIIVRDGNDMGERLSPALVAMLA